MDANLIHELRKTTPAMIADAILSVQPMSCDLMKNLIESSKTEAELTSDGFRPVSYLELLWVKDGR